MIKFPLKLAVLWLIVLFFGCSKPHNTDLDTKRPEAFKADSIDINVKQFDDKDTAQLNLEAELMYSSDQYTEALELYSRLLSVDSLKGKFNYRKGFCLLRLLRYKEAMHYYLRSIDLNYKKFESYKTLGIIYYMSLNDYTQAKKYFEKCLEINPNAADVKKYLIEIEKSKPINL